MSDIVITRLLPLLIKPLFTTFTETVGGTERLAPVITLTYDDTIITTTVSIANAATGETFEWTGDLAPADVLVIDCEDCHVKLNGSAAMLLVDGQFLHLVPGANIITVSGFSGTCNFTYRARYV